MKLMTKMRFAVKAISIKKAIFLSVFALLALGLLWKDALHFSIPVAFFIFIICAWKLACDVAQQEIRAYQDQIKKELNDAQDMLKAAKDRLVLAEKSHKDLDLVLDSILQSAHQEAAHILKKMEKDIDAMQENQRRQLDLENVVLRQKWKAVMAQDLLSTMRESVMAGGGRVKNSGKTGVVFAESVPGIISRKISKSFGK